MEDRTVIDETVGALKRLLAIAREDEKALRFLFVRTRDQTKGAKSIARGSVWRLPAKFSVPCAGGTRPRSALGRTTFHFDYSYVTKAAGGSKVVSSTTARLVAGNAAEQHHRYLNKGAFKCPEAMFAAYARDLPDRLSVVPEGLAWCGRAGTRRLWWSAEEGYFTNIDRDPEVVDSYWPAVHRSERIPGLPILRVQPDALVNDAWLRLAGDPAAPTSAKAMFVAAAADIAGAATDDQKRLLKKGVRVTDKEGRQISELLRPGAATGRDSPIIISPGRGGRTQYRLIAELPSDLDDTARARIAKDFCDSLNALGVMLEAVIHKPDHDNDHRNHHLHVIYHDRLADYLVHAGCWDFEAREPVPGRTGRSRPMQPKVKLDRWAGRSGGAAGAALVSELRVLWADINNRHLVLAGKYPRYDPRTYAEMGIDQEPAEHLDNSSARLSNAGVLVPKDVSNAEKYWTAEWRLRVRRFGTTNEGRAEIVRAATAYILEHPAVSDRLEQRLDAFRTAVAELGPLEEALLLADLYEDMARSRPLRTKTVALRLVRFLGERASARAERDISDVAERGIEAIQRLCDIDEMVAPLAELRRRRKDLRDMAHDLSAQLTALPGDGPPPALGTAPTSDTEASTNEDPEARRLRLLDRIIAENLPVVLGRDGRVSARTVLGLDAADAAFLSQFSLRGFFSQRFEYQERELGRLRAYRRKHSHKLDALMLHGRTTDGVPKAVQTLIERHGRHPEVDGWRQAARREIELREAASAAQKLVDEKQRLVTFFAKVEEKHWEVRSFDNCLSVASAHVKEEGVAELVRTSAHHEWVQARYAEIAARQNFMRKRMCKAIADLTEVKFELGGVAEGSFASDVQPVFRATRHWVQVASELHARIEQIERAAVDEIAFILRRDYVRLQRVCNSSDYSVPTRSLSARQTQFLVAHGARPLVKAALREVGEDHDELYRALRLDIEHSGVMPVDADGKLDHARVSRHVAGAAKAWRADAALAQLLKEKLEFEQSALEADLERIDKANLSFEVSDTGWRFNVCLPLLARLRLASPAHKQLVDERLTAIAARRDSSARAAADQVALEQRQAQQRAADERRRAHEREAAKQALVEQGEAELAREKRRQAQELIHTNERRLIDLLIKRIATEGIPFEISASGWKLDSRLTDSQQELLNLPHHADHVDAELRTVRSERELRVANEGRAWVALAQTEKALDRIETEDLDLIRSAEGWVLDSRLSPAEQEYLRMPAHRTLVTTRFAEIASRRDQLVAQQERQEGERKRLHAALARIESDDLAFDISIQPWRLDVKLSSTERSLIVAAVHQPVAKARLERISAARRAAGFEVLAQPGEERPAPENMIPESIASAPPGDPPKANQENEAYERLLKLQQAKQGGRLR